MLLLCHFPIPGRGLSFLGAPAAAGWGGGSGGESEEGVQPNSFPVTFRPRTHAGEQRRQPAHPLFSLIYLSLFPAPNYLGQKTEKADQSEGHQGEEEVETGPPRDARKTSPPRRHILLDREWGRADTGPTFFAGTFFSPTPSGGGTSRRPTPFQAGPAFARPPTSFLFRFPTETESNVVKRKWRKSSSAFTLRPREGRLSLDGSFGLTGDR